MRPLKLQSAGEQVAVHLRKEILTGHLSGSMPGVRAMATRLGINHKTAEAALALLEEDGLLEPQGPGRPRRIVIPENASPPGLRVRLLLYEPHDVSLHYIVELRHLLSDAGHQVSIAPKTLKELRLSLRRVQNLVEANPADAWIVVAGPREILTWFSRQATPAFALFGNCSEVALAHTGPSKEEAARMAVDKLIQHGHRRIVLLLRGVARTLNPMGALQKYLNQLKEHGITPGRYNLPVWDDTPEDLHRCLDALFQHTPPTALLIDDTTIYFAVQHYLSQHKIRIPSDISVVCLDPHPSFEWCQPTITHLDYDPIDWVRRVVAWTNDVAIGKVGRERQLMKAWLVEGGTIGPAPLAPART